MGTIFWGTSPLKIWEGKKRPKFGAILRNFTLRSQISPKRTKISTSGIVDDQLRSLPRSTKKNLVKFGPRTKSYSKIIRMTIFRQLFLQQPHQTFTGDVPRGRDDQVATIFGGLPPLEFGKAKTVQILARFCATSHFDRK